MYLTLYFSLDIAGDQFTHSWYFLYAVIHSWVFSATMWSFCRIYYGRKPILLVSDPDLLRHILIKDANNFIDRFVSAFAVILSLCQDFEHLYVGVQNLPTVYTYALWCSNSLQQLMNTFFIVFVWIQLGGLSIEYQIDGKTYPVLAFAKGDAWKRRRRLISPAFTASKLRLVSVCVHASMRVCMHRHLCMREA